jgi:threonine synthase
MTCRLKPAMCSIHIPPSACMWQGKMEKPAAPMVTLATAHPAKFPDAVKQACGIDPALPAWLSDLMQREERFSVVAQ